MGFVFLAIGFYCLVFLFVVFHWFSIAFYLLIFFPMGLILLSITFNCFPCVACCLLWVPVAPCWYSSFEWRTIRFLLHSILSNCFLWIFNCLLLVSIISNGYSIGFNWFLFLYTGFLLFLSLPMCFQFHRIALYRVLCVYNSLFDCLLEVFDFFIGCSCILQVLCIFL